MCQPLLPLLSAGDGEYEESEGEDEVVVAPDGSITALRRASIANGVQLRIKSGVGMGADTHAWQAALFEFGQMAEEEAQVRWGAGVGVCGGGGAGQQDEMLVWHD